MPEVSSGKKVCSHTVPENVTVGWGWSGDQDIAEDKDEQPKLSTLFVTALLFHLGLLATVSPFCVKIKQMSPHGTTDSF